MTPLSGPADEITEKLVFKPVVYTRTYLPTVDTIPTTSLLPSPYSPLVNKLALAYFTIIVVAHSRSKQYKARSRKHYAKHSSLPAKTAAKETVGNGLTNRFPAVASRAVIVIVVKDDWAQPPPPQPAARAAPPPQ